MFGAHMSLIFCQIQTFLLKIYMQILSLFTALLFSKRQYFYLIMLIVGIPLWAIEITITIIDVCAHYVVYLFPPHQPVRKKIHFHIKCKWGQMQKAMYNCRLHHRLKQQGYRRKRDKTVDNYDGWASYPLLLTFLQDAPYERNRIEAFINTHDPSRIMDYGNVLRLAPHENYTRPPMGPPLAAIGSLRARSALHRLSR
jgi:hypothetical protein